MTTAKKVVAKPATKTKTAAPIAKPVAISKRVVPDAKPAGKSKTRKPVAKPAAKPAPVAKLTKAEAAAKAKAANERNELLYRMTSVLVPIHFGNASVEKVFKSPQIRPESAISLMFIGSTEGGECEVGISMNLRPTFDRREAMLIPFMGISSLLGAKMVKWVKKPKDEDERSLNNLVLTAKGQKIFDIAKKSILTPFDPKRHYI